MAAKHDGCRYDLKGDSHQSAYGDLVKHPVQGTHGKGINGRDVDKGIDHPSDNKARHDTNPQV